jgi:hypothetical protein
LRPGQLPAAQAGSVPFEKVEREFGWKGKVLLFGTVERRGPSALAERRVEGGNSVPYAFQIS